jgi:hypothetical protein
MIHGASAMLTALAVDPQPWRQPPEVGEDRDGRGGHSGRPQSMGLFALVWKPPDLVAGLVADR